ncbi:MAG: CPBP family glutamic-type intramembrane protease [Polyangiaceae bacterium]
MSTAHGMVTPARGAPPLRDWVAGHPIMTFVGLTLAWSFFFWSWLFSFIAPGGLTRSPPPVAFVFVVLGGFGPSLAGVVTTWLVDGRDGVRALFARVKITRVGGWWLSLLLIPSVTALTPILRMAFGHPVDTAAMLGLVGPGLALGLVAGLMEELGWRGFLLPRLLERHSPAVATLLLGLVWGGLWHGYADYFGLGGRGWISVALIFLLGPVLLTAWAFVMTWVYERTRGSLALSYGLHASISSSALIFGQSYATSLEELAWTAVSVGLAVLVAIAIWLFARKRVAGS